MLNVTRRCWELVKYRKLNKTDISRHLPNFKKRMKKEYPVIEVPSDGKSNWYDGARCMLFVYSKNNGNFILKGYMREAENYLKKNYTHYFYYKSMWSHGSSRGFWNFWKEKVSIWEPSTSKKLKREKFVVRKTKQNALSYDYELVAELKFKRLPKRWIPEFDNL